jgi:hypothetical protein
MAYVAVANIIRRRRPNGHRPKYARENESKSNEHAASSPKQSTPITLNRAASGISNRRLTNVHALSARITGRYRGCRRRLASAATYASEVKQTFLLHLLAEATPRIRDLGAPQVNQARYHVRRRIGMDARHHERG